MEVPRRHALTIVQNKPSQNRIATPKAEVARSKTPQNESRASSKLLNARAPEFVPKSSKYVIPPSARVSQLRTSSLKESKKANGDREDGDEDGEVPDAAPAKAITTVPPSLNDAKSLGANDTKNTTAETKASLATTKLEVKDPVAPQKAEPISRPPELPSKPEQRPERKQEQKPATLPQVPPRPLPETSRAPSNALAQGRSGHGLPDRPELASQASRAANLRLHDRPGDRSSREHNDMRDANYRRHERPEAAYDQPSEKQSITRGQDRQERQYHGDREKRDTNWGGDGPTQGRAYEDRHSQHLRDTRPTLREERPDRSLRDRPYADTRDYRSEKDVPAPKSRDSSMAPPKTAIATHPDRVAAIQASQDFDRNQSTIHSDRRLDSRRSENQSHTASQRGPHTASPSKRDDHPVGQSHGYRDEKLPHDNRRYHEPNASSRHEDLRPPANASRFERASNAVHDVQATKPRDGLRSSSYSTTAEANVGRFPQDFKRPQQQESQYGRLNQDPPVAPRISNGPLTRNNRNVSAPVGAVGHADNQPAQAPPSVPISGTLERSAPTGPSAGRGSARNPSTLNRPAPISTSIPPASVTESPNTAGVHPDRLKAIQSSGLESSNFAQKPSTPVENQPESRAPPNLQSRDPQPPSRPSAAASTVNERGRGDKRFAGLNNVLSQANPPASADRMNQGTSIRGRHTRQDVAASSPRGGGPPWRETATPTEPRPQYAQDLFAKRPPSSHSGPARGNEAPYAREGLRSSDRKPPPRQRSMSPRRDIPPPRVREDARPPRMDEPRDYRGRGAPAPPAAPMPERERRGAPRDNNGPQGFRERRDYDRQDEWGSDKPGPERRERPERRASGMEEGPGSGRKRGRGPEESYDQGRSMTHEYLKRPRRGGG